MSSQYMPGTFLPSERELQEEYHVSRTMIREAIKQLSARGLLITTPRQGTLINPDFVGPATDSVFLAFYRSGVYMEDIWEARLLLEPHITELAAKNATPLQLRELTSYDSRFKNIVDDPHLTIQDRMEQWTNIDLEFHVLIAKASQNPVFPIMIEIIVGGTWRQLYVKHQEFLEDASVEALRLGTDYHVQIVQLIADRDGIKARRAMKEHLQKSYSDWPHMRGTLITW